MFSRKQFAREIQTKHEKKTMDRWLKTGTLRETTEDDGPKKRKVRSPSKVEEKKEKSQGIWDMTNKKKKKNFLRHQSV
jgi:hypothetical protein